MGVLKIGWNPASISEAERCGNGGNGTEGGDASETWRIQGSNKAQDGQGSAGGPESAHEDALNDDRRMEVIEPRPEPDPSARDDFHQEYTKKLQDADRDVEDFSKTLDSLSYPALFSSGIILLLIDCET